MNPGIAIVYLIFPEALSPEMALAGITTGENERATRFRFAEDANRWACYRAQLRILLGQTLQIPPLEVPLELTAQGKPRLSTPHHQLHFNLSHCADLGLLIVCRNGPVGVDLESLDRAKDLANCESTFCHPAEIARLPEPGAGRNSQLLEIWTAKEALLKALGTGLMHPPESVQVTMKGERGLAKSEVPVVGIENQRIHVLEDPRLLRYRAVVSAPCEVEKIEMI